MFVVRYFFAVLVLDLVNYAAVFTQSVEGKACVLQSGRGTCRHFERCKAVYVDNKPPELICGYENGLPVVCCSNSERDDFQSNATRPTYIRPAEQMCSRYAREMQALQEQPEPRNCDEQLGNGALCAAKSKQLFSVAEREAAPKEFPHMAAIGYDVDESSGQIYWICGGTLISENFVLTSATCLTFQNDVPKWVRVGDLNLKQLSDDAKPQTRSVAQMIRHPSFKKRIPYYHSIALLKLDSPVVFNAYVKPACLSLVPRFPDRQHAVYASWLSSVDSSHGEVTDMMTITISIMPSSKCNSFFGQNPEFNQRLPYGIDNSHICGQLNRDSCQVDSGGPLTVANTKEECMYDVIGISNFNGVCNTFRSVYTRVYNYVSWIESIVWPNLN